MDNDELQWPPFFGGKRAYSTARATVKAAKPHLNPLSRTSDRVTARAKPPEYLQASLLQSDRRERERARHRTESGITLETKRCHMYMHLMYILNTHRAHGSLRPLAANLCCVNSIGVPCTFHCCQSGMGSLLWPWSPPILSTRQTFE